MVLYFKAALKSLQKRKKCVHLLDKHGICLYVSIHETDKIFKADNPKINSHVN